MREQIITIKLKLMYDKIEYEAFNQLSLSYVRALNNASQEAFKCNKTSSQKKIHSLTYTTSREKYELPSQLACTVSRVVSSKYLGLWTTLNKNIKAIKSGHTTKIYKGLDKAPTFKLGTVDLVYGRDYSWCKDGRVSVMTLDGRIKLEYRGWNKHLEYIQEGAPTGGAKLWYDKKHKQWYLLVSITIIKEDIDYSNIESIKGVDVGIRNLFVSADTNNKTVFAKGGAVKHKIKQLNKVKDELKAKGTRSSKKRLVAIGNRERRFKANTNHILSKQIVKNNTVIGMEELKDAGQKIMSKRKRGKSASIPQKQANKELSTWSYAELRQFTEYKTIFVNSVVIPVNPHNTSKECCKCGFVSDLNRPNGSVLFHCQSCNYKTHSDRNAGNNIGNRTIISMQSMGVMGSLSMIPMNNSVITFKMLAVVQAPESLAQG